MVTLAAHLLGVPMAWLVSRDHGKTVVLASHGISADKLQHSALARVRGVGYACLSVADASFDPKLREDVLVKGQPGVRFFHAEVLFNAAGRALGVLAVADTCARADGSLEATRVLPRLAALVERLFERQDLLRRSRVATQILQTTFNAVVITDDLDQVVMVNRAGESLFGRRSRSMRGMPVDLLFPRAMQRNPELAFSWLKGGDRIDSSRPSMQLRTLDARGELHTLEAVRCAWRLPAGLGHALILRDITDQLAHQEKLRQLALVDPLTRLPNRNALVDMLDEQLSRNAFVGLALLELENFKTVNDTLGHSTGDAILQHTAARLNAVLPPNATVARFGGDEFAIVYPGLDEETIGAHLSMVLKAVAKPLDLNGQHIHLESTVGVTMSTDDHESANSGRCTSKDLIARADLALYNAKINGGRQWCRFHSNMRDEVIRRRELEAELRRAIVRGEFELHYQPQVDMVTGLTFGAEALLRWRHPERGLMPPAYFIDTLAASAMALEVGHWIILQACHDAARWPQVGGRDLAISINLFPGQVHEGNLYEEINNALLATGLSAERVELEITETVALRPDDTATVALAALRERGVKLSFDDFGTGYASLSMLQRFPIDRVKIDRSFVRDMLENQGDATIVRSIVLISQNMALNVIAEGVETEQQAQALRIIGCRSAQGFLYSPALPSEKFDEWLAAQTSDPASAPWLPLPRQPSHG